MDSTATLANSTELSTAFTNQCYGGAISTSTFDLDNRYNTIIYPNPTHSEIIVKTDNKRFRKDDSIQLYSILGKQFYSGTINDQETKLDLSNYPNGTYILHTTINGISKSFKIFKE
jgi:hypothetical protein